VRIKTKKHRLPEAAYDGEVTVAFTACEERRYRMFDSLDILYACLDLLGEAADDHGCIVPIYCFMPDHLHVILIGTSPGSRPKKAMDRFKQTSGVWIARNRPSFEWQTSFHDHIIRKSEDWRSQVQYIAANPIRAGLADNMFDYAYTGSIGCDWRQILGDTVL
jgi:putative transposase